ncbi:MAG: DNA adenine methylase [Chloroflexota bacterium]|nr:DNA adenine methylase [Chloroflexota bacterium]
MNPSFPTTRYQGSKRRLLGWIEAQVGDLPFESALDAFGGTGAVSYLFKRMGKTVVYNDLLACNHQIGVALIENGDVRLSAGEIEKLLPLPFASGASPHPPAPSPLHGEGERSAVTPPLHSVERGQGGVVGFIARTFDGIYFTADENRWLDALVPRIDALPDPYARAVARFALMQACLAKRPYNLFHRANLSLRQADVTRSFGNKTTWDAPFEALFRRYAAEANAAIFDNGRANRALRLDALDTPTGCDLVYFDPPYVSARGVGVDYADFYHFLEGLMDMPGWAARIDTASKHRRMTITRSVWTHAKTVTEAFAAVMERHRHSIIVLSYRADGIPSVETLIALLKRHKRAVRVFTQAQQYVLSTRRTQEVLLIGI